MTLYLIGIGLGNEQDITLRGLDTIKQVDQIYLEGYTSLLQCPLQKLEELYQKKIILLDRQGVENHSEKLIQEAKSKNIALLIIGDVFGATTHISLLKEAKEHQVNVKIINNASILTAVGITGLDLYKFGKTTSIPFNNPELEAPYHVLKENQTLGLHTLFLLDLKPEEDRFITVTQALEILEQIEQTKKENLIQKDILMIGCSRLGSENFLVKKGTISELKEFDFGKPPHCLIIPGKLHFMEEEVLELY